MRISAQGCMQIPGNVLRVRQRPCRAASRSGGWGGVTSLCVRTRGEPSSAGCEQRLSGAAAVCGVGVGLLRSAPEQGASRPPHAASRDCRTAHPLPVRSRVRLHRNAGTKKATLQPGKGNPQVQPAFLPAHPHAAPRAVPGWRGGLGRVGADLVSAASMRPPPSPARHVSTVRHATTRARQVTARHHKSQARNATPLQKPGQKRYATHMSPEMPPHGNKKTVVKNRSCLGFYTLQFMPFSHLKNSEKPENSCSDTKTSPTQPPQATRQGNFFIFSP